VFLLGRCISLMAEADLVVFAPRWYDGRGTNVEHDVATFYGMPILDLDGLKDFEG